MQQQNYPNTPCFPAPPETPEGPPRPFVRGPINFGMLFLFTFILPIPFCPIPGVNYMYMGMIKRGLVAMTAYFGTIYLMIMSFVNGLWVLGLFFALSLPVLILASAFDAFRLRQRINAGEYVTDNADDVLAFIRRNRLFILAFLGVLAMLIFDIGPTPLLRPIGQALPVALILFALWNLLSRR